MAAFHPFEVNVPHLAYAFLGGFIVLFGLFSLLIKERLYIGEAVVSVVVGIALGPYAIDLLNPHHWGGQHEQNNELVNEITLEITRVVIAIGVFAIGVELPKAYLKKHWKSLAMLLGPAMVWGWIISALFIWAIFPKIEFLSALAIAACVTPTDPILAQAVIGGKFADKHVPVHIRHLLSAESGSNDGAAFPFLYLALYLILDNDDRHAVGEWFYITWLYEVALGIVIGIIIGYSVRKIMKFSERKGLIDRQSFVAQYVSLAVLTIGICTLLGSDDLLAAFACGSAFAWDGFFNKATEDSMFSNVIDLLFNCTCFIYIGMVIPFSEWSNVHTSISVWRLFCLAIAILFLRRLPFMLAFYKWIPDIRTFREAAFTGWFGPMGVGAVFIATLAKTKLPEPQEEPIGQAEILSASIQPIVYFLVLISILCHGLSIPFFSLTKRVHSISRTWSRQSMGDEPAWASHARRINPGESIRINRDDDDREDVADDGTADRGGGMTEKTTASSEMATTDTTDSGPSADRQFDERAGEKSDVDAMERGEYNEKQGQGDERQPEGHERDDEKVREDNGRETPILAEYREGHHLIRERLKEGETEVQVEVIKDYFHDEKPSQISTFFHPQPLRKREVDKLHKHVDKSADHAADAVRDGGADQEDRLGLGLMGPAARKEEEEEEEEREEDNEKREIALAGGDHAAQEKGAKDARRIDERQHTRDGDETAAEIREDEREEEQGIVSNDREEDYEDVQDEPEDTGRRASTASGMAGRNRSRSTSKPPTIFIHSRPIGRRRESVRQQVFGAGVTGAAGQPQGQAGRSGSVTGDSNHLAVPSGRRGGRPIFNQAGEGGPEGSFSTRSTSRDVSPSTTSRRGLRFAEGTAKSSETAPGPSFYKRPASTNPDLAITRTASVQSNGGGGSGDTGPAAEEALPKGQTYYNRSASGGSGLQMSKTKSIQSIGGDGSDDEETSKSGGLFGRLKKIRSRGGN